MSEFDKYIYEAPHNVEEDPQAFELFAGLIERVFPTRIEFMPDYVTEVQTEIILDAETVFTIAATRNELSKDVPVYCVGIHESVCWPNGDDELRYEWQCEVMVDFLSGKLSLLRDLKSDYDQMGDLISTIGAQKEFLDSHTLFVLASKIEQTIQPNLSTES